MAEYIPNGVAPDPYKGSPNNNPVDANLYRSPNAPSAPGYGSPNGVGTDYSSPNMPRV